jgi:hypothetical protein
MEVKVGSRLRSATGSVEVVVIKAPSADVDLRCGGQPMVALGEEVAESAPKEGFGDATDVGKRYADEDAGVEVLCTKGGQGTLSIGSTVLPIKGAKPLPSSD